VTPQNLGPGRVKSARKACRGATALRIPRKSCRLTSFTTTSTRNRALQSEVGVRYRKQRIQDDQPPRHWEGKRAGTRWRDVVVIIKPKGQREVLGLKRSTTLFRGDIEGEAFSCGKKGRAQIPLKPGKCREEVRKKKSPRAAKTSEQGDRLTSSVAKIADVPNAGNRRLGKKSSVTCRPGRGKPTGEKRAT